MHKFLLILFLLLTAGGLAQPGDSIQKKRGRHNMFLNDSVLVKLVKLKDSVQKTFPAADSFTIKENDNQNSSGFPELQKNQQAREQRNAIIRIGIGVALLIVLIAGLRRKAKKK